jgi:hypothetical protein
MTSSGFAAGGGVTGCAGVVVGEDAVGSTVGFGAGAALCCTRRGGGVFTGARGRDAECEFSTRFDVGEGAADSSTEVVDVGADTFGFCVIVASTPTVGFGWLAIGSGAMLLRGASVVAAADVDEARYTTNPTLFSAMKANTTPTICFMEQKLTSRSLLLNVSHSPPT